jgi:galactose mutarotase-like enzyme
MLIAMHLAGLETVRLQDPDAPLEATFVPGADMICCSLRHRGEELLAQVGGLAEYAHDGHTMGIPLLYPWANRLAGFDYRVGDRAVRIPHDPERIQLESHGLPIHGVIGGRLAWELVPAPAPGGNALSARLTWDASEPDLFELFPFPHELLYEARLGDGRLELALTIHATGGDGVPLAFGFHPYISLPGAPRRQWQVELPAMRRLILDADQIPAGAGRALPAERFLLAEREFDDAFDHLAEPSRFAVTAAGRRVEVEFLAGYPCAQVFAPANVECICFEPMAAPPNALRSGAGLRVLRPGERARARFSVRVSESR